LNFVIEVHGLLVDHLVNLRADSKMGDGAGADCGGMVFWREGDLIWSGVVTKVEGFSAPGFPSWSL
jgi:hypothetical protein